MTDPITPASAIPAVGEARPAGWQCPECDDEARLTSYVQVGSVDGSPAGEQTIQALAVALVALRRGRVNL